MASLDLSMLQEMAASGALVDLNSMIEADGYDLSAYYQSTLDMFQNGGGQYGLPASYSNVVLYYNKDLFDAAGLPYPDDTMDWETFMDYAPPAYPGHQWGPAQLMFFGTAPPVVAILHAPDRRHTLQRRRQFMHPDRPESH